MTEKEFIAIMKDDNISVDIDGFCNACAGLDIIRKYIPMQGVEGAEHGIIYTVCVDKIVDAEITIKDAIKLRSLNWMIDSDGGEGLACFV